MKLAIAVSPKKRQFAAVPLQGPIDDILPLARGIGYDGIELNMGHPNEVDFRALKEGLERSGLQAVSIATGAAYIEEGLCLTADDKVDRRKAIDRIKLQCEFGSKIGAMVVIGMMRGRLDIDPDRAQRQRDWFVESLSACATEARNLGTTLIIEPMNRYETNYLRTSRETLDFLDKAGQAEVLLLLDTFHMNIEERDLLAAVAAARGRIGLVQTVDSNRCAPGMGHIDFGSIVTALGDGGYDGFLSAEVLPDPDGAAAARSAYSYLQGILSAVNTNAQVRTHTPN
jgi:5-keto-L-gluconate epimerase